jgi:hypothetical protein
VTRCLKPFAVVVLLVLGACATPHRPIPPGTYYPDAGEERIVVVATRIFFHVNVDPDNPDIIGSREYAYEVLPDGRIHFVVSSNSRFGLRLAMNYDWFWRDGRIARVERETGKTTRFALRE